MRLSSRLCELLEARVLLSAVHSTVLVHLTPQQPTTKKDSPHIVADRITPKGVVLENSGPVYTVAGGTIVPGSPPIVPVTGQGAGLKIVLEEGPNLRANAAAADAFARAASFIESIFSDPITVVIDAEIAALPAGIIGETSAVEYHFDSTQYDDIRNLLIDDSVGNEDIVTSLPTGDQFNAILPSDPSNPFSIGGMTVTRANLLALNMPASALDSGPASAYDPAVQRDMSMTFSTKFPFDFNPADGIAAGKIDFTGVVLHEIAHGLGFESAVDDVDYLIGHGYLDRTIYPTPLDLFRLSPGDGALDFTNSPRVLAPGKYVKNQVLYDGGTFNPTGFGIPDATLGDIPLSTGAVRGDGRQASHWKDDNLTNLTIGAMDPTFGFGEPVGWSAADTRALGLIGWNVVSGASITGALSTDANANGQLDSGEAGIVGARVYLDINRDGILEPSEPNVLTDDLGNYLFDNLTAGDYVVRAIAPSGSISEPTSSGFAHVTLDPNQTATGANLPIVSAPTPAPWQSADIGDTTLTGSDAVSSGAFLINGAGNDIWSTNDAFHFVYQPLTGDATFTVHLDSLAALNPQAKTGIMIRESLDDDSPNAFLTVTPANSLQITIRPVSGAVTQATTFYNTARWLRISRAGDTYRFYRSWDNIHWALLATRAMHLAPASFVGLAIDSHDTSTLAAAGYSNVNLTQD